MPKIIGAAPFFKHASSKKDNHVKYMQW